MFSSVIEFYKFVDSLIDEFHAAREAAWAADLRDAMASGSTSGEILGNLRIKFGQLQKTNVAKYLQLETKIELALAYLNEVLGHQ